MSKRPTVAALMAEIEALKKRIAALEPKPQRKDPNEEIFQQLKRLADLQEKERATRPPISDQWPGFGVGQPYWLRDRFPFPTGTITCETTTASSNVGPGWTRNVGGSSCEPK